jgi:hypothetical protein
VLLFRLADMLTLRSSFSFQISVANALKNNVLSRNDATLFLFLFSEGNNDVRLREQSRAFTSIANHYALLRLCNFDLLFPTLLSLWNPLCNVR